MILKEIIFVFKSVLFSWFWRKLISHSVFKKRFKFSTLVWWLYSLWARFSIHRESQSFSEISIVVSVSWWRLKINWLVYLFRNFWKVSSWKIHYAKFLLSIWLNFIMCSYSYRHWALNLSSWLVFNCLWITAHKFIYRN